MPTCHGLGVDVVRQLQQWVRSAEELSALLLRPHTSSSTTQTTLSATQATLGLLISHTCHRPAGAAASLPVPLHLLWQAALHWEGLVEELLVEGLLGFVHLLRGVRVGVDPQRAGAHPTTECAPRRPMSAYS